MDTKKKETGPWKLGGLSLKDLLKNVYKEMVADNVVDVAAALGYYFMLALFPMLIFFISLISLIHSSGIVQTLMQNLARSMPSDAYHILNVEVTRIMAQPQGGFLTFAFVGTLWAASSGVVALLDGLNAAYEVHETRSFIRRRMLAIGLTVALSILIILGSVLLMAGDVIGKHMVTWTGLAWMKYAGTAVNYTLGLASMFVGLDLIFYFGPNVKGQRWKWITPGALVSVIVFVLFTVIFGLYLRISGSNASTYGALGAVILLLLWLNFLGLAIIIGGEVNSEIAKAALAHGNSDAPKVSKEKEQSDDSKPISNPKNSDHAAQKGPVVPYPNGNRVVPIAWAASDTSYSVQAKRRIAMRRIKRMEDSALRKAPAGWAILKQPIVSLVYLGSVGIFMYQSISKRLSGKE